MCQKIISEVDKIVKVYDARQQGGLGAEKLTKKNRDHFFTKLQKLVGWDWTYIWLFKRLYYNVNITSEQRGNHRNVEKFWKTRK